MERPGPGDFAREYDETVRGMSSHFVWLNRSKESVALDLKTEHGREVMQRLVGERRRVRAEPGPRAAARLGLGADQLRESHPELVHCSISGYGEGGPYTDKKAYDLLVQCEAGLLSVTGSPEASAKVGISIADIAAGMYAYTGILTALIRRNIAQRGATIEISMLEALAEWMGFPMYYAVYGGTPPPRTGASHAAIAPYGPFSCQDGKLVFLGIQNQREWAVFCESVLRKPGLAADPRFASNSRRVTHRDRPGRGDQPDLPHDGERGGGRAGSTPPTSPTPGSATCPSWPSTRSSRRRHRWPEVDSPVGALRTLMPPATLDGDEPVMGRIPEPGEHTAAVLAELGISEEAGR